MKSMKLALESKKKQTNKQNTSLVGRLKETKYKKLPKFYQEAVPRESIFVKDR